ncbi:hypothetical protein LDENG_00055010 [Lucifuga dentata]|nr:hypothetical protein LDENG_00055010 [Lucifuga dentata]
MLELLQDKSLTVLVAQQKPRLKPHRTSAERPEDGSSQTLPSNLTEFERICRKNRINCPNPGVRACRDKPKKTRCCNCCQSSNKTLN